MVGGRGGPPSEAEEGRRSIMVRRDEGILEAVPREKSGRDTGLLVFDSQQESELMLFKNNRLSIGSLRRSLLFISSLIKW